MKSRAGKYKACRTAGFAGGCHVGGKAPCATAGPGVYSGSRGAGGGGASLLVSGLGFTTMVLG
jgi:hypothetical protein